MRAASAQQSPLFWAVDPGLKPPGLVWPSGGRAGWEGRAEGVTVGAAEGATWAKLGAEVPAAGLRRSVTTWPPRARSSDAGAALMGNGARGACPSRTCPCAPGRAGRAARTAALPAPLTAATAPAGHGGPGPLAAEGSRPGGRRLSRAAEGSGRRDPGTAREGAVTRGPGHLAPLPARAGRVAEGGGTLRGSPGTRTPPPPVPPGGGAPAAPRGASVRL